MRATAEEEMEIPDIRAIAAARDAQQRQRWRKWHWLVRPFVFAYYWFADYP